MLINVLEFVRLQIFLIEVIVSGIIDKTKMCEATNHSGMKCAIWVKSPPSLFHNIYSILYCIALIKLKRVNTLKKICPIKKMILQ